MMVCADLTVFLHLFSKDTFVGKTVPNRVFCANAGMKGKPINAHFRQKQLYNFNEILHSQSITNNSPSKYVLKSFLIPK